MYSCLKGALFCITLSKQKQTYSTDQPGPGSWTVSITGRIYFQEFVVVGKQFERVQELKMIEGQSVDIIAAGGGGLGTL